MEADPPEASADRTHALGQRSPARPGRFPELGAWSFNSRHVLAEGRRKIDLVFLLLDQDLADLLFQPTEATLADHPGPVVADSQSHLRGWYEALGFEVVGDEYLEDGIPHLPMRHP